MILGLVLTFALGATVGIMLGGRPATPDRRAAGAQLVAQWR